MKKFTILILLLLLITSCSSLKKTEQTKELMGTVVTITVYNENKGTAEKAIEAAFKEIERIENLLTNLCSWKIIKIRRYIKRSI